MAINLLSATIVKNAKLKADGKPEKYPDGGGLFLHVEMRKSGSVAKSWLMRVYYRSHPGAEPEEVRFSVGMWPKVSLDDARVARDEALKRAERHIHPNPRKAKAKATLPSGVAENTLEALAREWIDREQRLKQWVPKTYKVNLARFESYVFPYIGHIPFEDVTADDISDCIERLVARGKNESANRTLTLCIQVYQYAIAFDKTERNPAARAKGRGLIQAIAPKHRPAILDPKLFGIFLRDIYSYQGHFSVQMALRFAPLVFVRASELRTARWADIDFDRKLWTFSKSKIRAGEKTPFDVLTVPLSRQAIAILNELKPLTGDREYVFEGRFRGRPLSDNTFNPAFRRLGYSNTDVVFHGFRATARTLLAEHLSVEPELIERQLSHTSPEKLGRAYDRAIFLPQRIEMMQKWADYLDNLRTGRP